MENKNKEADKKPLEKSLLLESILKEADERARAEEAFLQAQLSRAYGGKEYGYFKS